MFCVLAEDNLFNDHLMQKEVEKLMVSRIHKWIDPWAKLHILKVVWTNTFNKVELWMKMDLYIKFSSKKTFC